MEYRGPATTVSMALDRIGPGRTQRLLLGYCGLAWAADACETMLLSYLGPSVACAWPGAVGPAAESALTSVVFAGMLAGVYALGAAADAFGRRRGFLLSAALLGAAGLASALAPSFAWLLLARCAVGVALGGTPIAVTLFAELAPSQSRGAWLLVLQSFWTLGTVGEALLAWAVLPVLGWRWLLALSAAPLLALIGLYPWLPESPHWLVSQHRYAEAEAVVRLVARVNGYSQDLEVSLDPGRQPPASQYDGSAAQQGRPDHAEPSTCTPGARAAGFAAAAVSAGASAAALPARPLGDVKQRRSVDGLVVVPDAALSGGGGGSGGGAVSDAGEMAAAAAFQPPMPPIEIEFAATVVPELGKQRGGVRRAARRASTVVSEGLACIFSPQLRRTTVLLWAIWFVNAITYYGLVLLSTALQQAGKARGCTARGAASFVGADYRAVLITSAAEAPGLLAAALLVDSRGRRWCLRAGLLTCAGAMLCLLSGPGAAGRLALLFAARAAIEGTFSVLYIYTPELYPTAARSFGLALCNAFSRLGGFAAPFATVWLVNQGRSKAAEGLLGVLCFAAAGAAFGLHYETRGRDLQSEQLVDERRRVHEGGRSSPQALRSGAGRIGSPRQAEAARLLAV